VEEINGEENNYKLIKPGPLWGLAPVGGGRI
jgi:hypothetical protein